jgi:WD40 repeat protein
VNRGILLLLGTALFCALSLGDARVGKSDGNLVPDGSFEQFAKSWEFGRNTTAWGGPLRAANIAASVSSDQAHSGAHSLFVSVGTAVLSAAARNFPSNAEECLGLVTSPDVTVGQNLPYRISLWARAGDGYNSERGHLELRVRPSGGDQFSGMGTLVRDIVVRTRSEGWVEFSDDARFAEGPNARIRLQLSYCRDTRDVANGSIFVDDISVTQEDPESPQPALGHWSSPKQMGAAPNNALDVENVAQATEGQHLTGGAGPLIAGPAFSPDGRFIAAAETGSTLVWDLETGQLVLHDTDVPSGPPSPEGLAFSTDGTRLALAHQVFDGRGGDTGWAITEWATGLWNAAWTVSTARRIDGLLFLNDNRLVTQQSSDQPYESRILIRDAGTGSVLSDYFVTRSSRIPLALSPDGTELISGFNSLAWVGGLISIDPANGWQTHQVFTEVFDIFASPYGSLSVAVAQDGRNVATGSWQSLRVFENGAAWRPLWRRNGTTVHVGFSPNGQLLVSVEGINPSLVRVLAVQSGLTLWSSEVPVHGAGFSPDGRFLAVALDDGSVQIWGSPQASSTPSTATPPTGDSIDSANSGDGTSP